MSLFQLDNLLAPLTPEEILKRVTEEQLWQRYFGNFDFNKHFTVPSFLRPGGKEDKNPSGVFFKNSRNEIVFHDFSFKGTYNIFTYLRKLFPQDNFNTILSKINTDFNLKIGKITDTKNTNSMVVATQEIKNLPQSFVPIKERVKIKVDNNILDRFNSAGLKYWAQYGISKETLDFFDVVQINGYELSYTTAAGEPRVLKKPIPDNETSFAFLFYDPKDKFKTHIATKVYRPNKDGVNFTTDAKKEVIGGLKQVSICVDTYNKDWENTFPAGRLCIDSFCEPYKNYYLVTELDKEKERNTRYVASFNNLIITKSMKDAMVWAELGVHSIFQQSEYPDLHCKDILKEFEIYYDSYILNYDNDDAGIHATAKILEKYAENPLYGLSKGSILISGAKDISDFAKKYGIKKAQEIYGKYKYESFI